MLSFSNFVVPALFSPAFTTVAAWSHVV